MEINVRRGRKGKIRADGRESNRNLVGQAPIFLLIGMFLEHHCPSILYQRVAEIVRQIECVAWDQDRVIQFADLEVVAHSVFVAGFWRFAEVVPTHGRFYVPARLQIVIAGAGAATDKVDLLSISGHLRKG